MGALLAVGQGKLSLEDITQRLAAGREQGPGEGLTAKILLLAALLECLGDACRCGGGLVMLQQSPALTAALPCPRSISWPVLLVVAHAACQLCAGPCSLLSQQVEEDAGPSHRCICEV